MRLILAIPDLLAQDLATLAASPALARLAHYAGVPSIRRGGFDMWLASVLAVDDPVDNESAGLDGPAPLAALGAGLDPGTSWLLRADPVSLVAGRADVTLSARVDDLDAGEADAMIATLNAHFVRDGLKFYAPRPDAWFVMLDAAPDVATSPLSAVRGAIYPFLPSGNHAGQWRRWMSEMQMLLHEHPVNAAREAHGRIPVTGVWIAEGGRVAARDTGPALEIFAPPGRTGDVARGLARIRGQAVGESPAGFAAMKSGSDALVVLDRDGATAMAKLESAWLRPAVAALERGALTSLCLLADGDGVAANWTAKNPTWTERLRAQFATRPFASPSSGRDDE